jgi:hypothetical protein
MDDFTEGGLASNNGVLRTDRMDDVPVARLGRMKSESTMWMKKWLLPHRSGLLRSTRRRQVHMIVSINRVLQIDGRWLDYLFEDRGGDRATQSATWMKKWLLPHRSTPRRRQVTSHKSQVTRIPHAACDDGLLLIEFLRVEAKEFEIS